MTENRTAAPFQPSQWQVPPPPPLQQHLYRSNSTRSLHQDPTWDEGQMWVQNPMQPANVVWQQPAPPQIYPAINFPLGQQPMRRSMHELGAVAMPMAPGAVMTPQPAFLFPQHRPSSPAASLVSQRSEWSRVSEGGGAGSIVGEQRASSKKRHPSGSNRARRRQQPTHRLRGKSAGNRRTHSRSPSRGSQTSRWRRALEKGEDIEWEYPAGRRSVQDQPESEAESASGRDEEEEDEESVLADDLRWMCSHCTYVNTPDTLICKMCAKTERKKGRKQSGGDNRRDKLVSNKTRRAKGASTAGERLKRKSARAKAKKSPRPISPASEDAEENASEVDQDDLVKTYYAVRMGGGAGGVGRFFDKGEST